MHKQGSTDENAPRMRGSREIAAKGTELPANSSGKQGGSRPGGTNSGTPMAGLAENRQLVEPELAAVVMAWPKLSAAVKAGILAMVKASGPG